MASDLASKRIALDNQAALANSQAAGAIARVVLYQALGGGWQDAEVAAAPERSTRVAADR